MTQSDSPVILVVDDETHILHVLTLKLENAGYRVITAEDGQEGFEAALQFRPQVIITDYQMPLTNGLDFCIMLKEHETTAKTPCLMLTARGYSLTQAQINRTNITAVMTKPFSPREILTHVRELIGHQQPAMMQEKGADT